MKSRWAIASLNENTIIGTMSNSAGFRYTAGSVAPQTGTKRRPPLTAAVVRSAVRREGRLLLSLRVHAGLASHCVGVDRALYRCARCVRD